MTITIKRDTRWNKKVKVGMIHGRYPYKMYLEVEGNSKIGNYIVVVGNEPLGNGLVNSVIIQTTNDTVEDTDKNFNKPNMIGKYHIKYTVIEVSPLDVPLDEKMIVFNKVKERQKSIVDLVKERESGNV